MPRQTRPVYQFGPFRLMADDRVLLRGQDRVHLTEKVFNILLLLVQSSGHLVTKEQLMASVWGDSIVEENNLTVSVSTLRKALGQGQDGGEQYIETVSKRGYRFVGLVREIRDETEDPDKEHEVEAYSRPKTSPLSMATPTLAVLPLLNANSDPNLDYLSEGIAESIINSLSQLHQLKVLARNTVFRYRGQKVDAQEVGRELNVGAVLLGSFTEQASRLIVSVELIDVHDGSQIWGEKYNQNISDILTVQEKIVKKITETLRLKLTGEERESMIKQYPDNFDAYQLYLKGRYFVNKRTEYGIRKAIQYLEQAIDIDPNYGLVYTALASAYNLLGGYGVISPTEIIPKVKGAAWRALEIDDGLAEAHVSLGHVKSFHEWDWDGGEAEFKRAIKLNPTYAPAHHWYGLWFRVRNRFDESLAELSLAQRLDPVSLIISAAIAQNFICQRQYDRAIAQFQHILELDPDFYIAHGGLGIAYTEQGLHEKGVAELRTTLSIINSGEAMALLGYALGVSGRRDEARETLEELEKSADKGYVDPSFIAIVLIGLNEKDEAFEHLEKAYEHKSEWLSMLNVFPVFDKLRSDARFTSLLRKTGHLE
ncbi:MAG TPA: winged helix-turn-helix domain-containing protein [Pyrinomonadaceae bacterium]|nr:winged helix-turn-helix domain-containing protein [Pyrinomonadaceae bacterium]